MRAAEFRLGVTVSLGGATAEPGDGISLEARSWRGLRAKSMKVAAPPEATGENHSGLLRCA